MSVGAVETIASPSAAETREVVRAIDGLSETVFHSMSALAERCDRAERELAALRASRGPADDRDALCARVAELERSIAAEKRLSRVGELAGPIGAEIHGVLLAARGFAELLGRSSGHERRWAARVLEGLDEVDGIATSLVALDARRPALRETLDADQLAASAIASVRRTLDARTGPDRWSIVKHVDCPPFAGDRAKLGSALRHLLANALAAIPNGGRVEARIRLDGGEIEIAVHDSGLAVPAQARRSDEPSSTTKGESTRLGLVLARAIAELHGGRLEVSAHPGPLGGAVTFLRLPFEPR